MEGREALPRAPLKPLFEKRGLRIPKNFPDKRIGLPSNGTANKAIPFFVP